LIVSITDDFYREEPVMKHRERKERGERISPRGAGPPPSPEERRREVEQILKLPQGYLSAAEAFQKAREVWVENARARKQDAARRAAEVEMLQIVRGFAPRRPPPKE
jgi:hypothetical protein